jgi:hypothetical protein
MSRQAVDGLTVSDAAGGQSPTTVAEIRASLGLGAEVRGDPCLNTHLTARRIKSAGRGGESQKENCGKRGLSAAAKRSVQRYNPCLNRAHSTSY